MSDPETTVVITGAARTPVGSFSGGLSSLPAHELGKVAISAAIQRSNLDVGDINEVIMGQVLAAGAGQNPARQAAVAAGIPVDAPAWGMNQLCGSGLRAVALAAQQVAAGDSKILRNGQKMGDMKLHRHDDPRRPVGRLQRLPHGQTAENVAEQWQITREMQDEFAVASQNKAEAAQKAGKFADEITPVTIKTRKGDIVVDSDEYIRHGATIEAMQKLRPAFTKDGTVTAANASGLNDGAAATLLMSAEAEKRGIKPLARIASYATQVSTRRSWARPDPGFAQGAGKGRLEGRRPRPRRSQRSLRRPGLRREQGHGLGPGDRERERRRHRHRSTRSAPRAPACSTRCCSRCSAATRRKGLATLCIGGGMGVALCVERD
jgi:acetyl-CoA C-acetyltransferase